MSGYLGEDLWATALVVQRGLALVYLLAFVNVVAQWRPLLGEQGLLPTTRFVQLVGWRRSPSLFHLTGYRDGLAQALGWVGVGLSVAALLGLTEAGPTWVSLLCWAVLWGLYLSFVNVGQIFYAFGWESLTLEAGFLAVFLGDASTAPPTLILLLLRWLVLRVELGAGLIKLRGDPCWRDLTCLEYHHETQPMPSVFSWYFHHLPRSLHRVEVLANHGAQLVVPFALFAPQPVATVAAAVIIVTQGWLVVSGNFAWLNLATIVLAFAAVDGGAIAAVLPVHAPAGLHAPAVWHTVLVAAVTTLVALLSWRVVRNLVAPDQRMNASFDPLHLVNTYGAFGSVTRTRYEVVIEGTADPTPGPRSTWLAYEFKAKPGDPSRRPRQWAPYHLRLDWLLWFVAMAPSPGRHRWFPALLDHLLAGDVRVSRLLRHDPFPDGGPAAIRALRYRYRFTSPEERRATGDWWVREPLGIFVPPRSRDG